jgi:hypothetical protein
MAWTPEQRECRRQANQRHRVKQRPLLRARVAQEYPKGCMDCGNSDRRVLQFHHRDGNPERRYPTVMISQAVSLRVLEAELEKCDLLCANCHLIRHAEGQ